MNQKSTFIKAHGELEQIQIHEAYMEEQQRSTTLITRAKRTMSS